jgi:hypothetical protein
MKQGETRPVKIETMKYTDLRDFIAQLEAIGELKRITVKSIRTWR